MAQALTNIRVLGQAIFFCFYYSSKNAFKKVFESKRFLTRKSDDIYGLMTRQMATITKRREEFEYKLIQIEMLRVRK